MNEEQWRQLRRAEMGLAAASDPEQGIRALTADLERLGRMVKRPGLSAECRRLIRQTAEQRLDEAGALKHGKKYTPKGNRGIREVRTFACSFQVDEE